VYPLDTVKTRIQSPDWTRQNTALIQAAGSRNKALFRGVYQGVGSVIIATLPSSATFFLTYNFLVKRLSDALIPTEKSTKHQLLQSGIHSASSAIAEIASCAILTPAEVIKQNAQVVSASSGATASTSLVALRKLLQQPGSLFRGYTALVSRNLPFTATQFPMYEEIRRRIYNHRAIENPTLMQVGVVTAISAGSAGSISAALTTPLDVVKTRMMLLKNDGRPNSAGMIETGRLIIREEGTRGIWRGGLLRAVWTALGMGLYLGTFECSKIYLARRRKERGEATEY